MLLSNPQLKYKNEAGEWIKLEDLYACDINVSSRPGRTNEVTTGLYTNEFVDNCRITFKQGSNEEFDKLTNGDETVVRIWDGAKWIQCTCNVASKYNKKNDYQSKTTLLTLSMNSLVEQSYIIPGGSGSATWGEITGDIQEQTDLYKELQTLEKYCDDLDATKLGEVSYIELSGSKGTLTEDQRTILLSGSPTLNYIDKDGMIFKCVFYAAGNKAVYSISGESKIHVITITVSTGAWELTTYNLAQPYTAGENITIENNVISANKQEPEKYLATITKDSEGVVTVTDKEGTATTFQTGGGSGGGVSQNYVDTQDQAILATATERIADEAGERAETDATLTEAILNETDKRTAADTTLQTNIDNEVVTRTTADAKLEAALESKLDKQTPGYKAVYGVTEGGDQYTFPFTENAATASTVAGRNNNGQIFCENPTEAKHAVNYEYFWANVPDSATRFAVDKEHTSSESWSREMTVYSNDKAAWLVLDCGGYTNDCAKALIFTDTKAYWGNDSFDYIDTNMIQWSWKDSTYRITYYPETHTFVVLTNNSVRRMMMIGI